MRSLPPSPAGLRPVGGIRAALLSAAAQVFCAAGYAEANVTDVVRRAGASVGALYHHFGGKADLYLALFEEYQSRQEARAAEAVRAARAAGAAEPIGLFVAGSRGYLHGCWAERELARLFLAGGGPPGFELVARRRYREWTSRNANLLRPTRTGLGDALGDTLGDTLVLVLTTVIGAAGHEVATRESREAAYRLTEEVLVLVARIGSPG